MRTSVDIPDPLLRKVRSIARKRKTTLRSIVLEGLTKVLEEEKSGRADYTPTDESYGDGGVVEGLAPGDWERITAIAYEGRGG